MNATETESPASLEELYTQYSQSVFRICLRYTRNEEDAEDLVHEVFMKVNAHLGQFEGRSTVFTWIYRVSVNECLSWLRSSKRRKADVEWIEELEPSSAEHDEMDARLLVKKIMGWTDAKTREILFMAYLEGLKQEEIAKVLNLSRRAVTKRLMVFREKVARLREKVEP